MSYKNIAAKADTAGFAVFCVSAYKREPRPPARIIATISFAIALFSPLTFPDICWKWFNNVGSARPYFSALSAFLARGLRAGFSAGSAAFSALGLRPRFAGAFSSAGAASAFGLRPRFAGAFSSAGAASAF